MTFRPKNAGEPVDARHSSHSWDTATAQGRESTGARPSRLLPLRKPRPLRLLSQGTGMWGMRGGGDLPGRGRSRKRRPPSPQKALAVCLCLSPSRKGSQKGLKDSLRSQPRAGVVPGASRCPVLPPSSCEGVRRTELGPN